MHAMTWSTRSLATALMLLLLSPDATAAKKGAAKPAPAVVHATPAALTRYPSELPLDVREEKVEQRKGATVHDVTFAGLSPTDRIRAYVVKPPGRGPFAGVLYVHWLGEPETTNRTQFLDDAVALATQGAVSVLVDAMWSAPGWYATRTHETDYERSVQQVQRLRRALDLLVAQPGVDPKRLGFVGHDFGAMYGALMGAVDQRPRAYVLMTANPRFSTWYLLGRRQPKDREAYLRQMEVLDVTRYLPALSPAQVFFQFASNDRYVTAKEAQEVYAAAKEPKLMRTYPTDHGLDVQRGAQDRFQWLVRHLKLRR
jgi:dienelactone hydrolase